MAAAGQNPTSRPVELQHPPHWNLEQARGAFPKLHPTHAHFHDPHLDARVSWTARRHRKGRPVHIHAQPEKHKVVHHWVRLWGWEFNNISWWVAQFFTWGSVVWCVNGWYALFPLSNATTNANIIGWTGLVGGTLFEIGAYCMVVEALNRGNAVRFGYEVRHLMEAGLTHFHRTRSRDADFYGPDGAAVGQANDGKALGANHVKGAQPAAEMTASNDVEAANNGTAPLKPGVSAGRQQKWRWWGYKWNNLGYLASFITFIGATVFWVATITGVPNELPDPSVAYIEWDFLYWLPQVLGSCCFITAALLFMLETQPTWWHIQPFSLGWHVGFWNFIGGVGFWLSGFFGFYAFPAEMYQKWGTALSTFWGAWAFLLGSYIQLVETLN